MAMSLDVVSQGFGSVLVYTNQQIDAWRAACTQCSYKSRANKNEAAIITRAKAHRCSTSVKTGSSVSEDKAHRYLVEGRVAVLEARIAFVLAEVRGSASDPYTVVYNGVGWSCNCDARVPVCAHIIAVRSVTDPDRIDPNAQPDEFDVLFGPRWVQRATA